jgi:DNA-binding transcriptional MerR regulator
MNESVTQKKVTIQEAAQTLNISRKTIYRWIDKGLISKVREENKTYVLLSEVKAICDKGIQKETENDTEIVSKVVSDTKHDTNIVTINRQHYEGLLIRLGQLESEKRYLLEYKGGLEAKDKELSTVKETLSEAEKFLAAKNKIMQQAGEKIRELEAEVARLKLPWWKKIWKK